MQSNIDIEIRALFTYIAELFFKEDIRYQSLLIFVSNTDFGIDSVSLWLVLVLCLSTV